MARLTPAAACVVWLQEDSIPHMTQEARASAAAAQVRLTKQAEHRRDWQRAQTADARAEFIYSLVAAYERKTGAIAAGNTSPHKSQA